MSAYLGKYHVEINGNGYIISQNRNGTRFYDKKLAPTFVSKTGTGDAAYRDGTFWSFFVQSNWRNGSKQLKFDDPGKFWKSQDVDTTQLEQLTLSRAFISAGQVEAGAEVNILEAWRSSTSWWNSSYGYRQQITITAPAGKQVPAGYPVKVTIDTAQLQTDSKVRSDRKDWRIVYFNGTSWVDLTRDYIDTNVTFFALQSAIAAGSSDSSYYAYYGYSAESSTKQPSTESEWNTVYQMFGTTPDSNSISVWHFREGSGTSANDETSRSNSLTFYNTPTWETTGMLGRDVSMAASPYIEAASSTDFVLGSLSLEGWFYFNSLGNCTLIGRERAPNNNEGYEFGIESGNLRLFISASDVASGVVTYATSNLSTGTWYHLAATYDGTSTLKLYVDGVNVASQSYSDGTGTTTGPVYIGRNVNGSSGNFNGKMHHIRISDIARSSFPYVLSASNQPSVAYGSELTTQPPSSNFDLYAGSSTGKMYKWDGTTSWTEQFDTRRITWYESGNDANEIVGDQAGTEKAKSQGFQVSAQLVAKGVSVYLKKNAGTPGNITVRIETDSGGKPSGTLVDPNATATLTAFTTTSYAWYTVEFSSGITLAATTLYHIVLKTAAATNDNNYAWAADASSPSYSSGAQSYSTDGGSTWTADSTKDQYFRLLGNATSINCSVITQVGGTQKMYLGTGNPTGTTNGDARLYAYDGNNWSLSKIFNTTTESTINSLTEYSAENKVYIGIGPQGHVYNTSDFSTFTLSKDINTPQNPGYIYSLKEYNNVLHAGGGSPEYLPDKHYNGFLYRYDTTNWNVLYPYDFTVVKSMEFYDAYLFIGTYRGDLYVYDSATLNPIFNFIDLYGYRVEIAAMKYFDDKLYIATYPQEDSNETNVGIWIFDRRGISLAHTVSGVTGYKCFAVCNGTLFVGTGDDGRVYQLSSTTYKETGYYQSSYFDGNLPSIDKLYNQITINHDPLATGQEINVYYRFKESDSWTLLESGRDNSFGSITQTLKFPAGIYSKKISLKIELSTSDTSSTPVLSEVIMQYYVYSDKKWQWTMRLKVEKDMRLLDKTTESRNLSTIRSDIEQFLSNKSLLTYTDADGSAYTVLVTDVDTTSWVINQNDVNENEVVVTMLEAYAGSSLVTDLGNILLEDSLSNVLLEDNSTILTQEA